MSKFTYQASTIKTDNYGECHEYTILVDGVAYELHDEEAVKELVRLLNEGEERRAMASVVYGYMTGYESWLADGERCERCNVECPKCGQYMRLENSFHSRDCECKCGLIWTFNSSGATGHGA